MKQFQAAVIPIPGVELFGHVLPWVEAAIGLLLITGLQTRPALIAGGLMMTVLMTGVMSIQSFQTAWLQLTYAVVFFILLACRSWNLISLDAWMASRRVGEPHVAGLVPPCELLVDDCTVVLYRLSEGCQTATATADGTGGHFEVGRDRVEDRLPRVAEAALDLRQVGVGDPPRCRRTGASRSRGARTAC